MSVYYDKVRKSWYFVIDLPRDANGKRKQMWRRGFKTEKLALKHEEEAKKKFASTDLAADGTVAAELKDWLEERELDIASTTLSNYQHAVNTYIVPHLGARQVYDLDKRMINDFYRTLLARGGKKGQGLAAETVRHVHRTFMKALKDLGVVIDGLRRDPYEGALSGATHRGRRVPPRLHPDPRTEPPDQRVPTDRPPDLIRRWKSEP
jgi:hypothetical protein